MSYLTNEDIEKDLITDKQQINWALGIGMIGSGLIGSTHIAMKELKDSMDKKTFQREMYCNWEHENVISLKQIDEPESFEEMIKNLANRIPPFEKQIPKKKAKVSDFQKRIDSFLKKK